MALTYDIDIQKIGTDGLFSDPKLSRIFGGTAATGESSDEYVAKFRNPATAEMLQGADETVRTFFKESGFAFLPSGVDLPEGRHREADTMALTDLMRRLKDHVPKYRLKDADWNGFDISEMIEAFGKSQAVSSDGVTAPAPQAQLMPRTVATAMGLGIAIGFVAFFLVDRLF